MNGRYRPFPRSNEQAWWDALDEAYRLVDAEQLVPIVDGSHGVIGYVHRDHAGRVLHMLNVIEGQQALALA